jgi:hypothetical protein
MQKWEPRSQIERISCGLSDKALHFTSATLQLTSHKRFKAILSDFNALRIGAQEIIIYFLLA